MIEVMIQDERSYYPEITTLDFNLYVYFLVFLDFGLSIFFFK